MSREFENRLRDWATWYHEQLSNGVLRDHNSLEQQVKFLKKAVDGSFELLAIAAKDLQKVERAPRRQLILPKGMNLRA